MTKRIVVIGSTGSIGKQTLEVVEALSGRVTVVGLAAGSNVPLLTAQAARFRPRCLASPILANRAVADAEVVDIEEIAALPDADLVVVATVGRVGLAPTLAAIRAGKAVAIANKEVLVVAGALLTALAAKSGAQILPIDSEHCAIWQCLRGEEGASAAGGLPGVARLVLTASGGPFRGHSAEALARVTAAQALHHPTWQMGPKVTVDSATLMNKGLEIIEARWLFGVPYDRIDVVLHPESIVHSMVEFVDGSLKAQLGVPDMRLPIQYALTYPARCPAPWPRLDIARLGQLSFGSVDEERFPCLRLARLAGELGGTAPAVLSAADEMAVAAFLAGRIGFLDIARLVAGVLEAHNVEPDPDLSDLVSADAWARRAFNDLVVTV